jgi:hypothetical protein
MTQKADEEPSRYEKGIKPPDKFFFKFFFFLTPFLNPCLCIFWERPPDRLAEAVILTVNLKKVLRVKRSIS